MRERDEVRVVNDQFGSPTYAQDLAGAILNIVTGEKWEPGIFHYCNGGEISWFDFAKEIQRIAKLSTVLIPISSQEFPTLAIRPKLSTLNCRKIATTYNLEISDWKISLENFFISFCDNLNK